MTMILQEFGQNNAALHMTGSNCANLLSDLTSAVSQFCRLNECHSSAYVSISFKHEFVATLHHLILCLARLDEQGAPQQLIDETVAPARWVHRCSSLIERMQDWPRGYPGDFETIELLLAGRPVCAPDTFAYLLERYILDSAVVQQHRNKVHHQAGLIRNQMNSDPYARILNIACGSCPDLMLVTDSLANFRGQIVLNDSDPGAIDFSLLRLQKHLLARSLHTLPGNIVSLLRTIRGLDRFNLITAGGLFDYLPNRTLSTVIRTLFANCLCPDGVLFFTNIAAGNPFRPWMEYCGDWVLIERTEEDYLRILSDLKIPLDCVRITRDPTELALLIEVRK